MLTTVFALVVLVIETALATFVAARAWSFRPSRLFVYLAAAIIAVIASTLVRDTAPTPEAAYPALAALVVGVAVYITLLLLLVSALFVPQWWEGRRPIIWICLPYVLITAALALEFVGRLGVVASGARFEEIYRLTYVQPAAGVLIGLSFLGQLVVIVILGVAYFNPRQRQFRGPILFLAAALIFSLALGALAGRFSIVARLATLVQTIPVLVVLGYAILGTRLFTPTRAALDLALQALREAVAVADEAGAVTYANPSAAALGFQVGRPLTEQIGSGDGAAIAQLIDGDGGDLGMRLGERQLELAVTPVRDPRGARRGTLLLARDVTEIAQRSSQLERERGRLAAAVEQLETAQRQRESLAQEVRSLSLPMIPVLPGVLILPLVGDFSGERINDFITVLLEGIERRKAGTVLIDITGLSLLDTVGAHGLLSGVRAAALLGARCVLVGVRPEVAQSLVSLGLSLEEIVTAPTLEQAVTARIGR